MVGDSDPPEPFWEAAVARGGAGLSLQPQGVWFPTPKGGSETRGRSGGRGSRGAPGKKAPLFLLGGMRWTWP